MDIVADFGCDLDAMDRQPNVGRDLLLGRRRQRTPDLDPRLDFIRELHAGPHQVEQCFALAERVPLLLRVRVIQASEVKARARRYTVHARFAVQDAVGVHPPTAFARVRIPPAYD